MKVNHRRYERLHYLFSTFRRDQLDVLHDVLDDSQWIELMTLYREMATESVKDAEEEAISSAAEAQSAALARRL
jgi:hypothetical protein